MKTPSVIQTELIGFKIAFPTRVIPNSKPGFFGYFLLPETWVFFNYQTRVFQNPGIAVAFKY